MPGVNIGAILDKESARASAESAKQALLFAEILHGNLENYVKNIDLFLSYVGPSAPAGPASIIPAPSTDSDTRKLLRSLLEAQRTVVTEVITQLSSVIENAESKKDKLTSISELLQGLDKSGLIVNATQFFLPGVISKVVTLFSKTGERELSIKTLGDLLESTSTSNHEAVRLFYILNTQNQTKLIRETVFSLIANFYADSFSEKAIQKITKEQIEKIIESLMQGYGDTAEGVTRWQSSNARAQWSTVRTAIGYIPTDSTIDSLVSAVIKTINLFDEEQHTIDAIELMEVYLAERTKPAAPDGPRTRDRPTEHDIDRIIEHYFKANITSSEMAKLAPLEKILKQLGEVVSKESYNSDHLNNIIKYLSQLSELAPISIKPLIDEVPQRDIDLEFSQKTVPSIVKSLADFITDKKGQPVTEASNSEIKSKVQGGLVQLKNLLEYNLDIAKKKIELKTEKLKKSLTLERDYPTLESAAKYFKDSLDIPVRSGWFFTTNSARTDSVQESTICLKNKLDILLRKMALPEFEKDREGFLLTSVIQDGASAGLEVFQSVTTRSIFLPNEAKIIEYYNELVAAKGKIAELGGYKSSKEKVKIYGLEKEIGSFLSEYQEKIEKKISSLKGYVEFLSKKYPDYFSIEVTQVGLAASTVTRRSSSSGGLTPSVEQHWAKAKPPAILLGGAANAAASAAIRAGRGGPARPDTAFTGSSRGGRRRGVVEGTLASPPSDTTNSTGRPQSAPASPIRGRGSSSRR